MARNVFAVPLIVLASLPFAFASAKTPVPSRPAAGGRALMQEALELWQQQEDYNGAQLAYYRAVAAAPDDLGIRFSRATFFETVSALVKPADRQQFVESARADYMFIIERDPNAPLAGAARDRLIILEDRQLFPDPGMVCGDEGAALFRKGEALFGAQRYQEALAKYQLAADRCPGAAKIWISYADAHFALHNFEMAKVFFARAIEAAPWSRQAHRYLADTEAELGDLEAAKRESEMAVLSDPTYESAWSSMRDLSSARSASFHRVPPAPPPLRRPDGSGDPDRAAWGSYTSLKADRAPGAQTLTPLQSEQQAVRATLRAWRKLAGSDTDRLNSFWGMMARAEEAGFLDEAIFLHLMDRPLVPEYVAFRDHNKERLLAYLENVIAPGGIAR